MNTPAPGASPIPPGLDGALLVDKVDGVSSFGVVEQLQHELRRKYGVKRRELPKLGHGGTLDPFATGLLIICVGRAVKLARYFLGSTKTYEGVFLFGQTTVPGDPTAPVSETSERLPGSIEVLRELAQNLTLQPYLQTPPMHSAKKVDGKPLYELARQGIEIDREAKLCHLHEFEILSYEAPRARFRVTCSSGTYIRTLAQDFARLLDTVGMLESLRRMAAGGFEIAQGMTADAIGKSDSVWSDLPCWVPFDRLLDRYPKAQATDGERSALMQGQQNVLFSILGRAEAATDKSSAGRVAIYCGQSLVGVAARENGTWGIERVFVS